MMKGLRLDISMDRRDSFDGMEDTYRREGLTVGSDYMRIHGVDFNVGSSYYFTQLLLRAILLGHATLNLNLYHRWK